MPSPSPFAARSPPRAGRRPVPPPPRAILLGVGAARRLDGSSFHLNFSAFVCISIEGCTDVHLLRLVFARCPPPQCHSGCTLIRHPSTQPLGGAGGGSRPLNSMQFTSLRLRRLEPVSSSDALLAPGVGKRPGRPRLHASAVPLSSPSPLESCGASNPLCRVNPGYQPYALLNAPRQYGRTG